MCLPGHPPTRPRMSCQLRLLLLKQTLLATQIPTQNTGRMRHNHNVALLTPRSLAKITLPEGAALRPVWGASPGPPSRRGTESGGSPAESEKEPRQPARRSADQFQAKDHLKRTRVTGPGSSLPGTPADLPGSSGGAQRSGTPRPVRQLRAQSCLVPCCSWPRGLLPAPTRVPRLPREGHRLFPARPAEAGSRREPGSVLRLGAHTCCFRRLGRPVRRALGLGTGGRSGRQPRFLHRDTLHSTLGLLGLPRPLPTPLRNRTTHHLKYTLQCFLVYYIVGF